MILNEFDNLFESFIRQLSWGDQVPNELIRVGSTNTDTTMDFDSTLRVPYIHTRVRTKLSVQREGGGAKA